MFTRRNLLRLVLFVLCALAAAGLMPEAWWRGSVLLPGLSPLLSLGGALAARAAGVLTLLGLPLLILPLFAGRFFCWRLCPMGFAAETVSRINRRNTGWIRKIPFVGKGLALLILGSAAAGWPVLIWTDPLSVFNGFFAAARQPLTWLSAATASGFILILLASLIVPNLWCHRLCPLGGLQVVLSQLGKSLRSPVREGGGRNPSVLTHADRTPRFSRIRARRRSGSLTRVRSASCYHRTDCGGTILAAAPRTVRERGGRQRRRWGGLRRSPDPAPVRSAGLYALCARCGNA